MANKLLSTKNEIRYLVIVLALMFISILSSTFYWFAYRPTKIRQECSWVQRHQDATAGTSAKTDEELRADPAWQDCTKRNDQTALSDLYCEILRGRDTPAQPARDWYDKASEQEYQFCIRSKGLNK